MPDRDVMSGFPTLEELGVTPEDWYSCDWDVMERPHVHRRVAENACTSHNDLPLNQADSRLMAASKDLYEALRECFEFLTETLGYCDSDPTDCVGKSKAALAKAAAIPTEVNYEGGEGI